MRKFRLAAILAALLLSTSVWAATISVDTGGAATNSGTTDVNTATVSGTAAVTCTVANPSVCTFTDAPNLSGIAADGTQAIYLACMTNANQKIGWIHAVDNTLKTVDIRTSTVAASANVTGCDSAASNYAIGGRLLWTVDVVDAALRPNDILEFNNSPASRTTAFISTRASGSGTLGFIYVRGKTGVRPVLNITSGAAIAITGISTIGNFWHVSNFEIISAGSGNCISAFNSHNIFHNIKISDCGATGISNGATGVVITDGEFTNITGSAISTSSVGSVISGNYVHDNAAIGIALSGGGTGPAATIYNNIVESNGSHGIGLTGNPTQANAHIGIIKNTIWNNGGSGVDVPDQEHAIALFDNIISENGNAAGEYNVEVVSTQVTAQIISRGNVFHHSLCQGDGTAGPACVTSNFTPDASDDTGDPLFTDAANGNFGIGVGSSAIANAWKGAWLGGASTAFGDSGAVGREVTAGGAATGRLQVGFQ